jgi:hypothetical protein
MIPDGRRDGALVKNPRPMVPPRSTPIFPPAKDDEFLSRTAVTILGGSHVATSTAQRLAAAGIDPRRLALLLLARGREAAVGSFKFKFIDADPETPDNFGVFVRSLDNARVPSGPFAPRKTP